jgi:hypothetical protein
LAVACAVAEKPPVAVAVMDCCPGALPRVQLTVKRPLASVVPFWGATEPPCPDATATLMETPATPPEELAALKTTWMGRTPPTAPVWASPDRTDTPVGPAGVVGPLPHPATTRQPARRREAVRPVLGRMINTERTSRPLKLECLSVTGKLTCLLETSTGLRPPQGGTE